MEINFIPILTSLLINELLAQEYDTIVTIPKLGQVGGSIGTFVDHPNRTYFRYKGIPFAEPVDRFVLAEGKKPWSGIHDGTVEGKVCPQIGDTIFYPGSVDERNCLVLTITTPRDPKVNNEPLPVLVFFYGGAFVVGTTRTAWYDSEALVQEDIIVVQVQYRLGVFGWLTDGDIIPKNIGLKDCLLGLEWVHDNIYAFGGDRNQVTIYGESAGAVITSILWQYPKAGGLFAGAILQSGTAVNSWSYQLSASKAFRKFVAMSVCSPTLKLPLSSQIQCLKRAPAIALATSSGTLTAWEDFIKSGFVNGLTAGPVLEDPCDPNAIIINPPMQQLRNGNISMVPILLSITSEEMLTFEPEVEMIRTTTNEELTPDGMRATDGCKVGKLIKEHYAGSEINFPLVPNTTILRLASDLAFNNGYHKFIELVQPRGTSVYCMLFDYASCMGRIHFGNMVGHVDDLFYTWKLEAVSKESIMKILYPPEAFVKRVQLNRFFANFVKTRNPTPTSDRDLEYFTWLQVNDPNNVGCLHFKEGFEMINNPKQENYKFWKDMQEQFGQDPVTI